MRLRKQYRAGRRATVAPPEKGKHLRRAIAVLPKTGKIDVSGISKNRSLLRESQVKSASFLLLLHVLCTPVVATTIYVPDHYPTIQDAIAASVSGDTIIVRPGTYHENIRLQDKDIVVRSDLGPAVTVLDGDQAGSVVTFVSGVIPNAAIEGFTIRNGLNDVGGGVQIEAMHGDVRDNIIHGNQATSFGGGIFCRSFTSDISGNTIISNSGTSKGGGIYCDTDSTTTIASNIIVDNSTTNFGGGIYCLDNDSVSIENNEINGNTAEWGGGIVCSHCSPLIANNAIFKNSAVRSGGGFLGMDSNPSMRRNFIAWNGTAEAGGGICLLGHDAPMLAVQGNYIFTNSAGESGGGIYIEDAQAQKIINNVIVGNRALLSGGGLATYNSDASIMNNTFFDNGSLDGGAIAAHHGSQLTVGNTILWNNSAPRGKEIFVGDESYSSSMTISHCDIEGGDLSIHLERSSRLTGCHGLIIADPLFFDSTNGDYHLTYGSPGIGAGESNLANAPDEDMEGDPRGGTGPCDIGADEYHPHIYLVGSAVPGTALEVRIVGSPKQLVEFFLGSCLRDPPAVTLHGLFYIELPYLWQGPVGTVPSSGILRFKAVVPGTWSPGETYFLQALVGRWNTAGALFSNLLPLPIE
jgi:predicted outer membrane repeat protein